MTEKNYYQILGVDQSAEDSVIRAAYKALAQKYHPDKFSGNPAEAQARMVEINQAYAVLSDAQQRRDYDQDLASKANESSEEDTSLDKEWRIACEYHPYLEPLAVGLSKLDSDLTMEFKTKLATSKAFSSAAELAKKIEDQYLTGYFGNNTELKAFAKEAILQGRRDVANEINQTLIALGDSVTAQQLIERVEAKHFPERVSKRKAEKKRREQEARKAREKQAEEENRLKAEAESVELFQTWSVVILIIFCLILLASI
jgi:curved DNA-binding protein CbpA